MPLQVYDDVPQSLIGTLTGVGGLLADCADISVTPVIDSFDPADKTNMPDLTAATFTGGAAKLGDTGAAVIFHDPTDDKWKARIKEPAGGWTWLATAATNLPQTVYGVKVFNEDLEKPIGTARLSADALIEAINDQCSIGDVVINLEDIDLGVGLPA